MSSKLTELTECSPSVPPPSVLCGSGILSQLGLPLSMASSGHFDPSQTYYGYKAVEVLDPSCTNFLMKGKEFFQHFNPKSSKFHFCFWEEAMLSPWNTRFQHQNILVEQEGWAFWERATSL
ncbi:hypothetical protein O181_068365 [Austropuccinia psidii MF-1]|uniref:Uncharacterized protein n=1 Tax=Austropuccinia psidii MF-1 TaxID=1389203 RepID=A0A9Q3F0V7_9BASI|nr:hypothetical protein [Austropuccinia psidii MF-1]